MLTGQDIRHVAAWLGHRDLGTTMVYTEQQPVDLIRATNSAVPGLLAEEAGAGTVSIYGPKHRVEICMRTEWLNHAALSRPSKRGVLRRGFLMRLPGFPISAVNRRQ